MLQMGTDSSCIHADHFISSATEQQVGMAQQQGADRSQGVGGADADIVQHWQLPRQPSHVGLVLVQS